MILTNPVEPFKARVSYVGDKFRGSVGKTHDEFTFIPIASNQREAIT